MKLMIKIRKRRTKMRRKNQRKKLKMTKLNLPRPKMIRTKTRRKTEKSSLSHCHHSRHSENPSLLPRLTNPRKNTRSRMLLSRKRLTKKSQRGPKVQKTTKIRKGQERQEEKEEDGLYRVLWTKVPQTSGKTQRRTHRAGPARGQLPGQTQHSQAAAAPPWWCPRT